MDDRSFVPALGRSGRIPWLIERHYWFGYPRKGLPNLRRELRALVPKLDFDAQLKVPLQAILERGGSDHASEFLELNGEPVHMFDCFALVNRLLCAAHLEETSEGKPTKTMFSNYKRPFSGTLESFSPPS